MDDPDRFALAAVQQYLHEHGYSRALAALQQESGLRVADEPARGSQLLQLVYDEAERRLAASLEGDDANAALRCLQEELLEGGSSAAGTGGCPARLRSTVEGLHAANIITVDCWPHRRLAITGGSDGTAALFDYDGSLRRTIAAASSGILCLALQRRDSSEGGGSSSSVGGDSSGGRDSSSSGGMVVAAGCMDGSVVVLDAGSGDVLARSTPHRKYVVACRWAPDGRHLVTAAWDDSFAVHRLQLNGGSGGGWQLEQVHAEQTAGRVNALEFLAPRCSSGHTGGGGSSSSSSGSSTFVVAVQGSNYLRQLSITTQQRQQQAEQQQAGQEQGQQQMAAAAAAVQEGPRINLNGPTGDDHVSFSAAHLALSPCGRLLLVSADNGRLLVYDTHSWSQLRSLIGLPTEQFHQFAAAWDASGHYVMAAAAHGALCVFHVGSARKVTTLAAAHAKNVRGLAYDAPNNLLLTCSFDRTVKLWEAVT